MDMINKSILSDSAISVLDSFPDCIFILNKEFRIVYVNPPARELLQVKENELDGYVCKTICKNVRCDVLCPVSEVLKSGKNVTELDSSLQSKSGKTVPVILSASVIRDEKNEPAGGIISFRPDSKKINLSEYFDKYPNFYGMIGKSKPMLELFNTIEEISLSEASVLITGETGVGKELVANAVKEKSRRKDKRFVKVNCAALPDTLLASELFGHVKGAFTDASKERLGRFEYADKGTIFLDEIGEIPLNMQPQLLRILQEGTFEKVGDSVTQKVDVRVIAATNQDLTEAISAGRFRKDLYYRLNVIPVHIPPLRERKEDIPYLVNYFIQKYSQRYKRRLDEIEQDALEILMKYEWPGNIRELENAIEYAFVRSKHNNKVCSCCLPPNIRNNDECKKKIKVDEIEKDEKAETLLSLLRQNDWNKTKVARALGVNRSTVHRRINSLLKENN